jgi:quercetin dioxygenase-like cupin family protein
VSHRILDTADLEGRRKLIARELGARAVKLNQFDSEPHREGFEHDESDSGQEEIYFALLGSGVLRVEGEEVSLEPGRYVLVDPQATRQVVAGPHGLSYGVVGAVVRPS